jgi:4-hydroxy-tetrahydrodipicolinate reductase
MGREVVRAIAGDDGMELVGAVDHHGIGDDVGILAGVDQLGVIVGDDLNGMLAGAKPDVMVDFTAPTAVAANARAAIRAGVRPVIGTTGMDAGDLAELDRLSSNTGVGVVVAPNFAVGAVLMMRFAEMAAKFFPAVEIIELHHDQKLDAPSGTALKTAEKISNARGDYRQNSVDAMTKIEGVRGGSYDGGIRIHSVRLPGLVAHQEVIFGGLGQTLTFRHDSISRESFMPGVILAVRRVVGLKEMVVGLENLIFE